MHRQETADILGEKDKWTFYRSYMEKSLYKTSCRGKKVWAGMKFIDVCLPVFAAFLKVAGLYAQGRRNAKDLSVTHIEYSSDDLPYAFDGYRILYITDLHLDALPGLEDITIDRIAPLTYDLCLMGGDFRKKSKGPFGQVVEPLKKIVRHINASDGLYTALGNHDTCKMVAAFEKIGLNTLINETIDIRKNNESIGVTGVDDPHYYFTSESSQAIAESGEGFKILLAHTPEICDLASTHGYQLYLCGHTHGGQICLPNGRALVTHLIYEKNKFSGWWKHGNTTGYTSRGAGVSGLPIRFFCSPEITLVTLRKI